MIPIPYIYSLFLMSLISLKSKEGLHPDFFNQYSILMAILHSQRLDITQLLSSLSHQHFRRKFHPKAPIQIRALGHHF